MVTKTSYDSKYGSGDRREIIAIAEYKGFESGENAFDGNEATHIGTTNARTMHLSFSVSDTVVIDEIELINSLGYKLFDIQLYVDNNFIQELNYGRTPIKPLRVRPTNTVQIKGENKQTGSGIYRATISEINLKSYVIKNKTLIKKDGQYGYYTDSFHSLGTTYPTKEQFEQYGMSDLSILKAGDNPVEYEMELVNETDKEKCFSYEFDLNGQHKNMKSIDGIIIE